MAETQACSSSESTVRSAVGSYFVARPAHFDLGREDGMKLREVDCVLSKHSVAIQAIREEWSESDSRKASI